MGIMKIVALTGLTYPTVRSAIDQFEQGGWEALKPKARGRLRGTGRVLSAQQETLIQEQIRDKRPEELGMSCFLWSRAAVGEFIEREYGIKLQVRSIGKYLARWGFTPQRPIKRAYEQNREAVHAWMQGEYPGIHAWIGEAILLATQIHDRLSKSRLNAPLMRLIEIHSSAAVTL